MKLIRPLINFAFVKWNLKFSILLSTLILSPFIIFSCKEKEQNKDGKINPLIGKENLSGNIVGNNQFESCVFESGIKWTDTEGNPIEAHGGGIFREGEIYYWYGENHALGTGNKTGISCYSSNDLCNWKNEGVVFPKEELPEMFRDSGVCERPKVIFNAKTGKYVMWMHLDANQYTVAMSGVAISDSPTGRFSFLGYKRPIAFDYGYKKEQRVPGFDSREKELGNTFRDMALFLDDDGKAYIIYSSEELASLYCVRLNDEFTDIQQPALKGESWERIIVNEFYEAPAPFKYKGKYYLLASGTSGWDPNPAKLAVSENIFGPWKLLGNPCLGPDSETTFLSQSTYVLPAPGKDNGSFVYMGDRWNGSDLEKSTYVWLPFQMNEAGYFKLVFFKSWDFSIFDKSPKELEAPVIKMKTPDTIAWKAVPGAKAYRIFKNAQMISITTDTIFHFPEEFAGTVYNYSVVAWNLSGKRSPSSNLISKSTDIAKPVFLSDMLPYSSFQGWGTLQNDRSLRLPIININGEEFKKGLGTHANSEIVYHIGGRYRKLSSWIGVDYFTKFTDKSSLVFEVWGDGEKLYQSPVMRVTDKAVSLYLDITGIQELRLLVNDADDGQDWDHADWGDIKVSP